MKNVHNLDHLCYNSAHIRWLITDKGNRVMRVKALCSGSSGNSYLVQDGEHAFLIDCGKSASMIERYVRAAGVDPAQLSAIFITHDHSDHIRGAAVLSRRFGIPVIANKATIDASVAAWQRLEVSDADRAARYAAVGTAALSVPVRSRTSTRKDLVLEVMPTGGVKNIGPFEINSFPVSHDAAEAVGYTFKAGGVQGTLITDTGIETPQMLEPLINSNIIVIEANHDQKMLVNGRYSWPLKQRILSEHGHLSNLQTAQIMAKVFARRSDIPAVWLIHLSHENNTAAHATGEIQNYLKMAADNLPKNVYGLSLQTARRDTPSLEWQPQTSYVQSSLF